jgi:hypothetical protein
VANRLQNTIAALNARFGRVQEYHPDNNEKVVAVNTGGGPGTPAQECGGGKFFSWIQFSNISNGNMIIHVKCASVPVFSIPQ